MKGYLDNLRPFERRLVVGVGVVVFVVLNFAFVFPHFSDWGATQARLAKAQGTLAKFDAEIAQKDHYEKLANAIQGKSSGVLPEDRAGEFSQTVNNQAGASHVNIVNFGRMSEKTTAYFVEKSLALNLQAKEDALVDFLYKVSAGDSPIGVLGLSLRPDQPRQNLGAGLTLVESFQKTSRPSPAAKGSASTSKTK
jgi:hypothetical protein